MEQVRKQMVKSLKEILDGRFIYGSYKNQPSLPYGNYGRNHSNNFFGDDRIIAKINSYTVRIVTNEKDFELEERVEDLFDELGIGYNVVTDEDIKIEKVHCTEWEIELLDGCK